jgi:hypothetical protein
MLGASWRTGDVAWAEQIGAFGPSDGRGGPISNVPGALAVLRDAHLYRETPEELAEALEVLETHVVAEGTLYPVAVAALPFLFELIEREVPHAGELAEVIASYGAAIETLAPAPRAAMRTLLLAKREVILGWVGKFPLAAAGMAVHAPWLRNGYLAALDAGRGVGAIGFLALLELDATVRGAVQAAIAALGGGEPTTRMAAAAFLAGRPDLTPDVATRVDAELPPHAEAALANLTGGLWEPIIKRPRVAPQLREGRVVFVGPKLVLVKVGERTVTLPWPDAQVRKGDVLRIGITAHYQPKLVILADASGQVKVVDFGRGAPAEAP